MSEASGAVADWLNLTQMTPGRVMFAMDQMAEAIETDAERALLTPLIATAHAAGQVQLEVEANWAQNKGVEPTRPEAPKVDAPADRCVGGIQTALVKGVDALAPADAEDEQDEEAQEEAAVRADAQALLKDHFIEGAVSITALKYEDQLAQMKRLVRTLQLPKNAKVVEKLGLGLYLRRLVRLLPKYAAALGQVGQRIVRYDEVSAARAATHKALAAVVGAVLGPQISEAARARLLDPVALQQRLMAEDRAARRSVRDVDRKTGRPIDALVVEATTVSDVG